jgi:hypothetical protein
VGAPVAVRVHRAHLVIWRDTTRLAEHARAPDGAHQRVVIPEHYSLLFTKKPRAQVMLYREALIQLGPPARWYMSELSHRRRAHLQDEVVGVYTLWQQVGAERLLAAMVYASERTAYGVAYLQALLARPTLPTFPTCSTWPGECPASLPSVSSARDTTPAAAPALVPTPAAGLPGQEEVDRALHLYEAYVCVDQANANEGAHRNGNANVATASGTTGTTGTTATTGTGATGLTPPTTPTTADRAEAPR